MMPPKCILNGCPNLGTIPLRVHLGAGPNAVFAPGVANVATVLVCRPCADRINTPMRISDITVERREG